MSVCACASVCVHVNECVCVSVHVSTRVCVCVRRYPGGVDSVQQLGVK